MSAPLAPRTRQRGRSLRRICPARSSGAPAGALYWAACPGRCPALPLTPAVLLSCRCCRARRQLLTVACWAPEQEVPPAAPMAAAPAQ